MPGKMPKNGKPLPDEMLDRVVKKLLDMNLIETRICPEDGETEYRITDFGKLTCLIDPTGLDAQVLIGLGFNN